MYRFLIAAILGSAALTASAEAYEVLDAAVVVAESRTAGDPTSKYSATFPRGDLVFIESVDGERLRVYGGGRIGIVRTDELIPVNKAIDYFTQRIEARAEVADLLGRAAAHDFFNDRAKAMADLDRALELDPRSVAAYNDRASLWIAELRYDRCYADAALTIAPTDVDALHLRAVGASQIGKYDEAIADFRRAEQLEPTDFVLRNNRAKMFLDLGRNDEALADLNEAIRLYPAYADAYANRGIVHHRRRNIDAAIRDATTAVKHDPNHIHAFNNRANAYVEQQKFDLAAADFEKITEINPEAIEGYYGLANTCYLAKDYPRALENIERVIKRSPLDHRAWNTKGNILKALDKPREAITSFTTGLAQMVAAAESRQLTETSAIKRLMGGERVTSSELSGYALRAEMATLCANRADAYRSLLDKDEDAKPRMFADLDRAVLLRPDYPMYLLARGQQHYFSKNYREAAADFSAVLVLQPNSRDGYRGRVLSAYELKDWDMLWRDAQALRDAGSPVDEPTLAQWRKESGRDYPDAKPTKPSDK